MLTEGTLTLQVYLTFGFVMSPVRINANQIKPELDKIIAQADIIDPQLATRLRRFSRWIKDTKPGSLTKKPDVMGVILEVMKDARTLLDLRGLDPGEKLEYYGIAKFAPPERYWFETLFPLWFEISDPKLDIWTKKLMAEEFPSSDREIISKFANEFNKLGAPILKKYILDLSMATDLIISGLSQEPLAVQLTKSSLAMTIKKQGSWKVTLMYWSIQQGVFFSHDPRHQICESATSMLQIADDTCANDCYRICMSSGNYQ